MARRGQSPRESDEEIRRALKRFRQPRTWESVRRWIRGTGPAISTLVKIAAVSGILLTAGLVAFHLYRGASFGTSFRMAIDDYRVAVECRNESDVILDFVNRSIVEADEIGLAERLGDNWIEEVCQGALKGSKSDLQAASGPTTGNDSTAQKAVTPVVLPTVSIPQTPVVLPTVSMPQTPVVLPTVSIPQLTGLIPSSRTKLEAQLLRSVFEELESNFYGGCAEPPNDRLRISKTWSGSGVDEIEFVPPSGTYFLVLAGQPRDSQWHFDSTLETSTGRRHQSLHIDSSVPDDVTDAQEWCTEGFGITVPDLLHIDAQNLGWKVYLVREGIGEELPRTVASALTGYYGLCPPTPPIESLQAQVIGRSSGGSIKDSLSFVGSAPHYFLGIDFKPTEDHWYFRSVNVSGDWESAGPRVSSTSGETIDFTATCPSSSRPHHLDLEAMGGEWVMYLFTVSNE